MYSILLMAGAACATQPEIAKRPDEISASLIQVIAWPEKFNEKYLVVGGYLEISSEIESSLFLDENSQMQGMTSNSIAVDLGGTEPALRARLKQLNGKYVFIAGSFKAGPTAFSDGTIGDIYRVIPASGSNANN